MRLPAAIAAVARRGTYLLVAAGITAGMTAFIAAALRAERRPGADSDAA